MNTEPEVLCVYRTSSSHEARRALETLRNNGYQAELDAEEAPDALAASNEHGATLSDVDYLLWVPEVQADTAAELLAQLGFESELEPLDLPVQEKAWVTSFRKWLGRVIALLVVLWLIGVLRTLIDNAI